MWRSRIYSHDLTFDQLEVILLGTFLLGFQYNIYPLYRNNFHSLSLLKKDFYIIVVDSVHLAVKLKGLEETLSNNIIIDLQY